MASLESRPHTPQPPVVGERDEAERSSEIAESDELQEKGSSAPTTDSDFVHKHLRLCDTSLLPLINSKLNLNLVAKLKAAASENDTYGPASQLLTSISKTTWKLAKNRREALGLERYDSPLEFVDHHSSTPTHYPLGDVADKPDLLGVFPVPHFFWNDAPSGRCKTGIPHYRVETMVELKGFGKQRGVASQLSDYVLQHLRARPDHPGVYGLTMHPEGFSILYGDTSGPYFSEDFAWDKLDILAAYVLSIYDPPEGHMLRDSTIRWDSSDPTDPLSAPLWTVTVGEETFARGELVFCGDPWGRRTTIFKCLWPDTGFCVVIKDYYRQLTRRFDEGTLVNGLHAEGFVPGVVRFASVEDVLDGDDPLTSGEGTEKRTRRRYLMTDTGVELLKAKSVNDLLKVVYDVLEVHRTLVAECRVLHRDMSIHNILMYPKWGKFEVNRFMQKRPPLIEDILAGKLRDEETYQASCLLIDFDNSAKLIGPDFPHELTFRTGTPMYISRAVSAGSVWATRAEYVQMPELSPEARELYDKVHGPDRYDYFKEAEDTVHGGVPPKDKKHSTTQQLPFFHKPEYDAESVFWSTLSALLRVQPDAEEDDETSSEALIEHWQALAGHRIQEAKARRIRVDQREATFLSSTCTREDYLELLLPCMKDVGSLLYKLAEQVAPSYALMETPPPRWDHLHEAMQRLILDYLVEHRDKDIKLNPTKLRSTEPPKPRAPPVQSTSNARKRTRECDGSEGQRRSKRVASMKEVNLPIQATRGFQFNFNFPA